MKVLFAISLLLLANTGFTGVPDSVQVYQWEEIPETLDPKEVIALSFHKLKLEVLPANLAEFENLEYLILSKNKLKDLPEFVADLASLRYVDLSQNRLKELPEEICALPNLEELILNRNELETLPTCISNAAELRKIDLWLNPVRTLPETLVQLKHLEKVDLSGIKFSPTFQEDWYEKLPRVQWIFEEPCNCME